jgi:hypothetical protein
LGKQYFRWRGGLIGALIAAAVVVGILYSRGALSVNGPTADYQSPSPISVADGTCRQQDVTLTTIVNGPRASLGLEVTVGVSFPNNMSCMSPDVTAELEDSRGISLVGVNGSPLIANSSHTCSTNVSAKCVEETTLYWSNWCGPSGTYQIVATAFGGHLRSSSPIPAPPPCTNHGAPSLLGGIRA